MDYMIVYAHPNPRSFNFAVRRQVEEKLREKKKTYIIRDLYLLHFNPVLSNHDFLSFSQGKVPDDIKKEQEYVGKADTLIFIYPIWWFAMPAIVKGYIDRVFSRGFAYSIGENGAVKGELSGKKAIIFNTTGGGREQYERLGYKESLRRTVESGTLQLCGLEIARHEYFYAVPTITDRERKKMLEQIALIEF